MDQVVTRDLPILVFHPERHDVLRGSFFPKERLVERNDRLLSLVWPYHRAKFRGEFLCAILRPAKSRQDWQHLRLLEAQNSMYPIDIEEQKDFSALLATKDPVDYVE